MPSRLLILIVDDDPTLLPILKYAAQTSFPKACFVQVHSTGEARTYFNRLDGFGPRLILLDINLNERVNGLDFLAFLRANVETHSLPVVMLTVGYLAADLRTAYGLGASCYTIKPFDVEGWKNYLDNLRLYWFETVTLPPARYYNA